MFTHPWMAWSIDIITRISGLNELSPQWLVLNGCHQPMTRQQPKSEVEGSKGPMLFILPAPAICLASIPGFAPRSKLPVFQSLGSQEGVNNCWPCCVRWVDHATQVLAHTVGRCYHDISRLLLIRIKNSSGFWFHTFSDKTMIRTGADTMHIIAGSFHGWIWVPRGEMMKTMNQLYIWPLSTPWLRCDLPSSITWVSSAPVRSSSSSSSWGGRCQPGGRFMVQPLVLSGWLWLMLINQLG